MKCKFVKYLLAAVLSGSCSAEGGFPGDDTLFAVRFSVAGIDVGVSTRSATPAPGTSVCIGAFRRAGHTSDLSSDVFMGQASYTVADGGTLESLSPLLLPAGEFDFYAWTPGGLPVDRDGSANGSHIPWSVSVAHGTDYACGMETAAVNASGTLVSLTLSRYCSLLNFALVPGENANYTEAEILSVELANMTESPVISQINRALPLEEGKRGATVRMDGKAFSTEDRKSFAASSAVLPRCSDGNRELVFRMEAKFNGGSDTTLFSAPVPDMAFEPGYQYTFKVKIRWMTAVLVLDIEPWGGEHTVDAGGMGEGNRVTLVLGEWTDLTWGNMDMGGNGTASLTVSGWEANENLSVDMGG